MQRTRSLRSPLPGLVLALGLSTAAAAQADLIHYPFVTGSGTSVLNLATGGPKTGTLVTTNTTNTGWVAGVGGGFALSGRDLASTYAYVDSGLNQGSNSNLFTGSFTVAFFMKRRINSGTLANYFFSGIGSFRMFTGGVAYEGLYLRDWGGAPADIVLPGKTNAPAGKPFLDLQAAVTGKWVHVALVVDSANSLATWYIDGSPFSTTMLTTPSAAPTGTGNFRVGNHTGTTTSSDYDMDDFRLSNRAAAPHEIQQWALAKLQADQTDVSVGGQGSQKLKLDAGSANQTKFYWLFGSLTGTWPETVLGKVSIPLVVDPYTQLALEFTNTPVFSNFRGLLDGSGQGSASFNVPSGAPANVIGLTLLHSYVVYDAKGVNYTASNAAPLRLVK